MAIQQTTLTLVQNIYMGSKLYIFKFEIRYEGN